MEKDLQELSDQFRGAVFESKTEFKEWCATG